MPEEKQFIWESVFPLKYDNVDDTILKKSYGHETYNYTLKCH